MTYTEKTIENFLEELNFDVDFYIDLEDDPIWFATDFLESYSITIETDCDYRNDQNEDGYYYCDLASERADSKVDYYNFNLRKKAYDFQDFIEDALNEFGYDQKRGIM